MSDRNFKRISRITWLSPREIDRNDLNEVEKQCIHKKHLRNRHEREKVGQTTF